MSHVTHPNESCPTYSWVISHVFMNHVTNIHKSHGTYGWWAMSHILMSHVPHIRESCPTYLWVTSLIFMSHTWCIVNAGCSQVIREGISHVTRIHGSWCAYWWAMSHIFMSHVTNTHESYLVFYECRSFARNFVLQCVAVCCSVLQYVLQCDAVCSNVPYEFRHDYFKCCECRSLPRNQSWPWQCPWDV